MHTAEQSSSRSQPTIADNEMVELKITNKPQTKIAVCAAATRANTSETQCHFLKMKRKPPVLLRVSACVTELMSQTL